MPPLPEAIILVLAPFAPLFSQRVWRHAQVLLLGAMLAPGARTVTAALRVMGLGDGAPLHQLPSGLEPGHLVSPPGQSDSVGLAHHAAGAPGSDDRPRGGRHRGTPQRPQDHGQRLLSRCGALHQEARHPLFWPEVGVDDALGAGALEPAGVGVALSHRPVLACRASAASAGIKPVSIGSGR